MAGNKNVISAYLENVGQGHHLQQSYLSYYDQTFIKMMHCGWQQKRYICRP